MSTRNTTRLRKTRVAPATRNSSSRAPSSTSGWRHVCSANSTCSHNSHTPGALPRRSITAGRKLVRSPPPPPPPRRRQSPPPPPPPPKKTFSSTAAQTDPTMPRGIRPNELWERISALSDKVRSLSHTLAREREYTRVLSERADVHDLTPDSLLDVRLRRMQISALVSDHLTTVGQTTHDDGAGVGILAYSTSGDDSDTTDADTV